MGLYSGGLVIGRIFGSDIWGVYFREGLFLGGLIIGILRYVINLVRTFDGYPMIDVRDME